LDILSQRLIIFEEGGLNKNMIKNIAWIKYHAQLDYSGFLFFKGFFGFKIMALSTAGEPLCGF